MELRYTIARLLPDPIRDEPINIGIILQSDKWVRGKFIERIPKAWQIDAALVEDLVELQEDAWKERLTTPSELVYLPDRKDIQKLRYTDAAFLDWIRESQGRHLQFTEIREARINIENEFDFDTFLNRLYATFVAPKPRPRKPPARSRLRTQLKREFKQLHLPGSERIKERGVVQGTFAWPIDFAYSVDGNGRKPHEVAIGLVDFALVKYLDRAKELLGVWADVKTTRPEEVERISILGSYAGIDAHDRTLSMLRKFSDIYIFEREKNRLLDRVASDLHPFESLRNDPNND